MRIKAVVLTIFTVTLTGCASQGLSGRNGDSSGASPGHLLWLANSLNDHAFSIAEAADAAGIEPDKVRKLLAENAIPRTAIWHNRDVIKLLPYPGGRHPRIGFLDGAINPTRGTKVSLFTPWNERSYLVLDLPEAIFSSLGLIWLSHTHAPNPTVWDMQGLAVEQFEWDRREDGGLRFECHLPNEIRFGALVRPANDGAEMKMWLCNGTDAALTELRTQVCIMFKGAEGFRAQTNENKNFEKPVGIARHSQRDRYILTAWKPCHVVWGNPLVPCLHSDPIFPDCAPGQTVYCYGVVVFYEGKDIDQAVLSIRQRLEAVNSFTHGG